MKFTEQDVNQALKILAFEPTFDRLNHLRKIMGQVARATANLAMLSAFEGAEPLETFTKLFIAGAELGITMAGQIDKLSDKTKVANA